MKNFKTDNLAVFFGIIAAIVTGIAIGSIFTIMSINVIFGTDIPVSLETVASITWLTIVIGGAMKGSKQ
jgi:hypothetical protein